MPLDEQTISLATPKQKPYKLFDTGGLYLLVQPNGGLWWRFRYRLAGKEYGLSFGTLPSISLEKARACRDEALAQLAAGINPSLKRQTVKQAAELAKLHTFQAIATEWLAQQSKYWSLATVSKAEWMLNTFVYPKIGDDPVTEIKAPAILAIIKPIEGRGMHETARRTLHRIGQVLRYAIATARAEYDVTAALKGALLPARSTNHPAITDPVKLGQLLRDIYSYRGKPAVCAALQLAPLLFLRPGELRKIEWGDVNLIENVIKMPAHKMKTKKPHIVPLCTQAVQIISALHDVTGEWPYMFPNDRAGILPMSTAALTRALIRLGYDGIQTPHGFRATARTILDEVLAFRPEWVEMQLAHEVRDANGRAYNRTAFLPQRASMLQSWADYLDQLRLKSAETSLASGSTPA